jgi:retron-type reverse transcriptase
MIIKEKSLFTFSNLYYAYKDCLSGKVNKSSSIKFEENLEKNLLRMSIELQNKTYTPGPFTCFAISEPKLREVWAADFKDRILHHLLVSEIEPKWEKIFIHDSYACRKWKGAHKAILKMKKILRCQKNLHYLHVDVKGFFTNINRDVLYKIISKKIKSPDILYLSKMIIFHDPRSNYIIKGNEKLLHSIPPHKSLFGAPNDRGLPIGNYTSQFFANIYLNELDQYAKRILKCHYYFRYMDDVIILSPDQKYLSELIKKIDTFLNKKLKLELHPEKTTLQKCEYGIDALGYIIHPEYTLSRKRIVGNVREKLVRYNKKTLWHNRHRQNQRNCNGSTSGY